MNNNVFGILTFVGVQAKELKLEVGLVGGTHRGKIDLDLESEAVPDVHVVRPDRLGGYLRHVELSALYFRSQLYKVGLY